MSVQVFDKEDGPYLRWMDAHPTGFVLNIERRPGSKIMVLHKSKCGHIASYASGYKENPFTGQDTIKVCSETIDELRHWIRSERSASEGFSHYCRSCSPI